MTRTSVLAVLLVLCPFFSLAQESNDPDDLFTSSTFSGLSFRSIGPALTSGRVSDIAVHPDNRKEYYLAIASGGVWKTVNAGTTWEPIFDDQPSFSIGCVTIDPNNPLVVWVGTGENNSQRSVSHWRRRLQVRRCREELEECRSRDIGAHRQDHR